MFSLMKRELWNDLFLLQEFKFFDYSESLWIFYLDYICILIFIGMMAYFVFCKSKKFMKRIGRNNDSLGS